MTGATIWQSSGILMSCRSSGSCMNFPKPIQQVPNPFFKTENIKQQAARAHSTWSACLCGSFLLSVFARIKNIYKFKTMWPDLSNPCGNFRVNILYENSHHSYSYFHPSLCLCRAWGLVKKRYYNRGRASKRENMNCTQIITITLNISVTPRLRRWNFSTIVAESSWAIMFDNWEWHQIFCLDEKLNLVWRLPSGWS